MTALASNTENTGTIGEASPSLGWKVENQKAAQVCFTVTTGSLIDTDPENWTYTAMEIYPSSSAIPKPTYTPKAKCTEPLGATSATISMSWASACGGTCGTSNKLFSGSFSSAYLGDLTATWECCMAGLDLETSLELRVKLISYDTVNAVAGYDEVTITFNSGTAFTAPTLYTFDLAPIATSAVQSTQTLTYKVPIQYAMPISTTASNHSIEVSIVTQHRAYGSSAGSDRNPLTSTSASDVTLTL